MRIVLSSVILFLLLAATSRAGNVVVGAPLGPDGQVIDTPEVSIAKAEHAAAHVNQKINLANEAARSNEGGTGYLNLDLQGSDDLDEERIKITNLFGNNFTPVVQGAPIGPDGRVVDTPEVVAAKEAHVAAHVNEKIKYVNEAVRSIAADSFTPFLPLSVLAYSRQDPFLTPILAPDGTVLDNPEVVIARAAHAAAQVNERINLAKEQAKSNAFGLNDVVFGGYFY